MSILYPKTSKKGFLGHNQCCPELWKKPNEHPAKSNEQIL